MSDDKSIKRDDPMIAAEYSLGLLEGEELLAARGKVASDEAFAWRKDWWDNWFAPLSDEVAGKTPGDHVWMNIQADIDARTGGASGAAGADVVQLQASITRWKWIAGLTSAAAAVALAFLAIPQGPQGPSPVPSENGNVITASADPLVASVPIGDSGLRLAVTYLPGSEEMLVSAAGLTADGVHDHELWLVPEDGSPLQSLGIIAAGEERKMPLPASITQHIGDGVDLVLTREPLGGKPEGVDAGPVVASGKFSQV